MESMTSLKRSPVASLARTGGVLLVGELEHALLERIPAKDACSWDRTGMLVGNPADRVRGVAVALDPTVPAILEASSAGANVLVTHHPVFLDPPTSFLPASSQGQGSPGVVVRCAIEHGVSIISFHTALDVSPAGLDALAHLLRLEGAGVLEPLADDPAKGFGRICRPCDGEGPLSLRHLSARCVSVFGVVPRVWGSADLELNLIVTSGGSAGSLGQACLSAQVDCLVCGEMKYHEALEAAHSGLAIIELGHDVSEFPLCAVLASHLVNVGIDETCITMIDQENNWYTPETLRR